MYIERWTIDELTESTATLLRSRYEGTLPEVVPSLVGARPRRVPSPNELANLRSEVMAMERAVAGDDWTEEIDFVLDRVELQRFVAEHRARAIESPADDVRSREIREGDVFWVVASLDLEVTDPHWTSRGITDTQEFLTPFREAAIWDVTPAARQAAKVAYSRVVRRGEEREREV